MADGKKLSELFGELLAICIGGNRSRDMLPIYICS